MSRVEQAMDLYQIAQFLKLTPVAQGKECTIVIFLRGAVCLDSASEDILGKTGNGVVSDSSILRAYFNGTR